MIQATTLPFQAHRPSAGQGTAPRPGPETAIAGLSYRVDLWDAAQIGPEQLVAMTVTPALGYAVYYAAAREYPDRVITLSSNGRLLSRWSPLAH